MYKRKFKILLLVFVLIFVYPDKAFSQYVGLSNSELDSVKKLIRTDSEAKKQYETLKSLATKSLIEFPTPVDTIFSEGILAGNPKKVKTQTSLKDVQKAYALAVVYCVEGGKKYRNKAVSFIKAWAMTNKPQGNPINDTKLEALIEAYDMLKKEITPSDDLLIQKWLSTVADKEVQRKLPYNNWNSHRIKIMGMVAYTIGDTKLQEYCKEALETQIEKNLNQDGSGFDFQERDALHYHAYTLQPLLKLSIIIKRAEGKDYYSFISKSESSIDKSVNFLIPFLTGEKIHSEFVNSKVSFDRARAKNNESTFRTGAPFNPEHGISILSLASFFLPELLNTPTKMPVASYLLNALAIPGL